MPFFLYYIFLRYRPFDAQSLKVRQDIIIQQENLGRVPQNEGFVFMTRIIHIMLIMVVLVGVVVFAKRRRFLYRKNRKKWAKWP